MKDLEFAVKKFLTDRDWDKLRPSDLAKSISIEAAELLEIFQWSNPELHEVKADPKKLEEVKKEVADILIYALQISTLLDLDTEEIVRAKLAKAEAKYPAELMKNRDREPGTEDLYWQIKKEYRRKDV